MTRWIARVLALVLACGWGVGVQAQAKPEGEMRFALYVTISPAWLDPGEVIGQLTPFWLLYAVHDALVKPMPGKLMAPSLAESWTESADHKSFEFKLREGVAFHNGDPFTAEDVKFSFARAKGAKILQDKVREVTVVDRYRVRFQLAEPWPDFMTFYGTLATSAGWIAPKKYMEQVGVEGFKKHPIGLGPYKFVSHTPGVELVMEAFEGYWRKTPSVKRLVYKSVLESTTRLAMLKRGEVDIAYLLDAPMAEEIKRDPTLKLAFSGAIGTVYLDFLEQWDPKSPWADRRVRLAASLAVDRKGINEAENLGASRLTGNIVPRTFDFAIPLEPHPYDPARARQLLAEAGYPGGRGFPVVYYLYKGDSDLDRDIGVELQGMYARELGINMQLQAQEWTVYLNTQSNLNYDLCRSSWVADYNDPNTFLNMFVTNDGNNRTGWSNAQYDERIAAAGREVDLQKRYDLFRAAEHQLVVEDPPVCPLYYYVGIQFFDGEKLGGIEPNLLDEHPLKDIYWKKPR
jgi:ABC-type transport system substrate-binding protein